MDDLRFDALAKSASQAPSRRQLLRLLGGGGVLAGLGAVAGRGPAIVRAESSTCLLDFTGSVRLGASAGKLIAGGATPGEVKGQISFILDGSGAIGDGQLTLPDGSTTTVTGQANGSALTLRLGLHGKEVVVAVGAAARDVAMCQGSVNGLLTGPQHGDLGDWYGSLRRDATAGSTGGAPANGSTATGVSGTETGATTGTTEATETATSEATEETPVTEPTDMPTTTACVDTLVDCNGVCLDLQNDVNNCGSCGNVCPEGQTGYVAGCTEGNCFYMRERACSSGLSSCDGTCVDKSSDPNNCGACGNTCASGQICFNGTCAVDHRDCPDGQTRCGGTCVDTYTDAGNCGACGNSCATGQICFSGTCAVDHRSCPDGQVRCGSDCVAGDSCP